MNITNEQLSQMLDGKNPNVDVWVEALNAIIPLYDINTPRRVAAFIAQAAHESANFTRLRENLNYSASGLMSTWPKRFNQQTAQAYARQPEKIANKVYANRMGNGDETSGDGWRFKGRGLFQITGHDNYLAFSTDAFGDDRLLTDSAYVETPEGAIKSACWYWNKNNLNDLADVGNIKDMTWRINGGYLGLEERQRHYTAALNVLEGTL
jgi:putative chitinase